MATERFFTESGNSPPVGQLTLVEYFVPFEEQNEALQAAFGFTEEGLKLLEDEYDPHDMGDFFRGCLQDDNHAFLLATEYNAKAQEVQL